MDNRIQVPLPLLAVELLSPSNRGYDLVTKRNVYGRAKVASYWIVDPDEPSVTVSELGDDVRYAEVASVAGSGIVAVTRPFEVRFSPVDLVRQRVPGSAEQARQGALVGVAELGER